MGRTGRPLHATAAQRTEVERLAAVGLSIRAIAEQVFGDASRRGRVERILRPRDRVAKPLIPEVPPLEVNTSVTDTTAVIRAALDRLRARVHADEAGSSAGELRALLDVQRRLDTREAVERINALTRVRARG